MKKVYRKTHESEKAMQAHILKIKKRGGSYIRKGNVLEYVFVKKGDNTVLSKNSTALIKEAAIKGYRNVKVTFKPAYNAKLHQKLPPDLVRALKKNKVEYFDVVEETQDIIRLLKSNDVVSVEFV